jgi:ABC-type transport system involved in multi-copper enzyme maturation permease subunit
MKHQGSLIANIALWLVAALGVLFIILIYSGSEMGIEGGLWLAYAVFFLCTLMAIGFAIAQMVSAGRKALPTLMGLAAFAVVLGISYVVADGSVRPTWDITTNASKWIGAGITMTLIATGVAVLAILYGEITRMLK